jgi:hypothetical protein
MEEAARFVFSASVSLLAGYTFMWLSFRRRFSSSRLRADRFALHVLAYSFTFFVCGESLATIVPPWTPQQFARIAKSLNAAGISATVINAIVIAVLLAVAENVRIRLSTHRISIPSGVGFFDGFRFAALAHFIHKSNDAALRAIFRACILRKSLMVTLKSHKVYVGKPNLLPWEDPTEILAVIRLMPLRSGFRDAVTKKVTLTTKYDHIAWRLVELGREICDQLADPLRRDMVGLVNDEGVIVAEVDINDIGVVISWPEVESLTIFDENLYEAFQRTA